MTDLKRVRALLGPAAIITPTVAAAWLPFSDAEARRWLRHNDLIHDLAGRQVVVWGEVVARVKEDATPNPTRLPAPLRRTALAPL